MTRFLEANTPTQVNSSLIGVLVKPGMTPPVPPVPPTPGVYETTGIEVSASLKRSGITMYLTWDDEVEGVHTGNYYLRAVSCDEVAGENAPEYVETLYYDSYGNIFRTCNRDLDIGIVDGEWYDDEAYTPVRPVYVNNTYWDDPKFWIVEREGELILYYNDFLKEWNEDTQEEEVVGPPDMYGPVSELGDVCALDDAYGPDACDNVFVDDGNGGFGSYWVFVIDEFNYYTDSPVAPEGITLFASVEYRNDIQMDVYEPVAIWDYSNSYENISGAVFDRTNNTEEPGDGNVYYVWDNETNVLGPYAGVLTLADPDNVAANDTAYIDPNCGVSGTVTNVIQDEIEPGDPGSPGQPAEPIPVDCTVSYSVDGKTWNEWNENLTDENNVIANVPRYMYLKFSQDVEITEE